MPELRDIPSVDVVLSAPSIAPLTREFGHHAVRDVVRALQDSARTNREVPEWMIEPDAYAAPASEKLNGSTYQPIFNLTGTVIHTNLGRALLSESLWERVGQVITRPTNLEFDVHTGRRGDRDLIVEERLRRLTGCEAATIVNNNAAALFLVLNTFALNQAVPVSRGELIEIGGSFRLPELMARSGCSLLEVGTTNRTHLKDYEAVVDEAAMLLKVHPSNYHVSGFTKEVDARSLAELAAKHNIPSCVDLGSGTLINLSQYDLPLEPTPQSVLEQGIDLVTFSGDKLLGGAQAGLIVGRADLLEKIKKNPLKRALRADKMTLAVLDETLKLYESPDTLDKELPLLRSLTLSEDELSARADRVSSVLPDSWHTEVIAGEGQIGSGALPDKTIASICLAIQAEGTSPEKLLKRLRELPTPVIGRIADNKVILDMRGADPLPALLENLSLLK